MKSVMMNLLVWSLAQRACVGQLIANLPGGFDDEHKNFRGPVTNRIRTLSLLLLRAASGAGAGRKGVRALTVFVVIPGKTQCQFIRLNSKPVHCVWKKILRAPKKFFRAPGKSLCVQREIA
jgi:hypothetical protein